MVQIVGGQVRLCTEGKPLLFTELTGTIASPTMYNIGNYPPNSHCMWEVKVLEWMVSLRTLCILSLQVFKIVL